MNIAILTNKPYDHCETFIKAQMDNLPFPIYHYWGNKIPFNLKSTKASVLKTFLYRLGIDKNNSNLNILSKELRSKQIDVVLAQYGTMGMETLKVCQKLNLPLVVHFHGHDAVRKSILKRYNDYNDLFSYNKLTVISVSNEMTKRLISIGCDKDKIKHNVYGPSDSFLNLFPNYNKKQFISIGRFVEKKAPHLTILAFKQVVNKHKDAKLIYAGDGNLLDSCKDLVEALDLTENIIFAGRISSSQYQFFLKESIAYVQHSIEAQDGDMEGTPVSILEASAAGLPIISTLHAGIPDVILHQETGLLSKEKDIQTMTHNLLWIIEHIEEAKKMGMNGKKRIAANYTMTHHIDNLTRIITEARSNK